MSAPLSQNSPAGRRSHIRVVRPVDVAAVLLHTEARAFTRRALTRLPLGVRPTVLCGPGNSVRRHNRTAFIRFAARIFQIDYETQAELHALLIRATKLAGGMP